ncbi:TetR/AcrR family transcriptional regulator [Robinsoniella peoriensis]|uniref:TetR/AcrR family transcriptional regulator n=1 Tax=Robinsoniella peoriensis TaxID=180332 RepID=UPI00364466E7
MAKGLTLTKEQILQRQNEIASIALSFFNKKGFQKTSMREIAEAAGMGKSSLYDFFTAKDEIVVFIVEEKMKNLLQDTRNIITLNLSPTSCLKKLMEMNLTYTKENNGLLLWVKSEERFLVAAYQKRLKKLHYDYQDMFQSVIERGISDGFFRNTDSSLATRLLINSMLYIVYTTRPSNSPEDMLNMTLDIFLHGIII